MSENLKRAESLFNRIMNQNGALGNDSTSDSQRHHKNHHPPPPPVELPKRDPIKIAQETLAKIPSTHHILPFCWTVWFHTRWRTKDQQAAPAGGAKPLQRNQPAVDLYLQTTNEIEFPVIGDASSTTTSIGSIEQLWMSLSTLKRVDDLAIGSDILLFKSGVAPVWEDPINTKGGRWVFRFNRRSTNAIDDDSAQTEAATASSRKRTNLIWERLVLRTTTGSLIPELVDQDTAEALLNDICGLVLSVRRDEDIILVWNSNLNFKKKERLLLFQARRIICDAILRVIRECDLIAQGSDCVETADLGLNERVFGVSFEYRLHADNPQDPQPGKYRRNYHHNHPKKDSSL